MDSKGHAEESYDKIIELQRKVGDLSGRLKSQRLPFDIHSLVAEVDRLMESLTIGPNQAVRVACRDVDTRKRDAMFAKLR